MRFVRFKLATDKKGIELKGVYDKNTVKRLHGSIFEGFSILNNESYPLEEIEFLPPVLPTSFICTESLKTNSYLKSVTSLTGSKNTIRTFQQIYCIPRIGLVLDPRVSERIFGVTMVMDFVTSLPYPDIKSSVAGFTATGPSLWTSDWNHEITFTAGSSKKIYFIPEYKTIIEDVQKTVSLRPGDVVALPLSTEEPYKCSGGDYLRMTFGDESMEVKIGKN